MLYAEKGNKVKTIDESQIDACVARGYTVVNEYGTVVKETIPTGVAELRLAYTKNAEEIDQLKATIAKLEAELAVAQAEVVKKSVKAATPVSDVTEEVMEDTPKPKRTRKATE